jgi:hypothetical protein
MRKPVPDFARNGVASVSTDVAAMPVRKTVFPPNFVARYPPGN